jgi:hypothetical protein
MKKPKASPPLVVHDDFIQYAERVLSPERVKRAQAKAKNMQLAIRLADLREKEGLRQNNVAGFSQSSVSRIEGRADMKLSTVTEYLDSLGYEMELVAVPKKKGRKPVVLLKAGA